LNGIIQRLRGVIIENKDATEVMKTHDSIETLHYVDPPYVSSTRGPGGDYNYEMNDSDHKNLSEYLHSAKGIVVLSGYPSALYDDLYHDWSRYERESLADGARKRKEILWINRKEKTLFDGESI
jgi:DNA adenine methylase